MKLLLLFTFVFSLSVASHAQVKYPPLKEEDVDFSTITDGNYLMYKLSTTKPITRKREIEQNYVIKNFDWKDILINNSEQSYRMAAILIDSLNLREPLADENLNCIYYHAKISNSLLPLMMYTKCSFPIVNRTINGITNLYDLSFTVNLNLKDKNKKAIVLGNRCEISTKNIHETNETEFTFAIEILDYQFDDIEYGSVGLNIGNFKEPEKCVIKKTDVGDTIQFHSRNFEVLAFDNGVLHLKYKKLKDTFKNYNYFGNINGEKFSIKSPHYSMLYLAYDKYRQKPKLSYNDFKKYDSPKKMVPMNIKYIDSGVAIFNFGYDIDSLNIYLEERVALTTLRSVISVNKQDENYSFVPIINSTPTLMASEVVDEMMETIRTYFRKNVRTPAALKNGMTGSVSFKFTINPNGTLTNIKILKSSHSSFSDEVILAAKRAKLELKLEDATIGTMSLHFSL